MKTRKKIHKDTLRNLLLWKSPKRTYKYFHRKYEGPFSIDSLYIEPMVQIYSRKTIPPKAYCFPRKKRKVTPFPLKRQTYVWRLSGGLLHRI